MREDADVDTLGRANEAEHRITEEAVPPAVVGAVPNENLRDTVLPRKIDDCGYRIVTFQHFGGGSRFFCGIEISSNRGSFPLGPARLANIYRVEIPLKPLLITFPAFDHGQRIGMRRHADEEALVGAENGLDAVRMDIGLQLRIDDFGGQQQGKFAEF